MWLVVAAAWAVESGESCPVLSALPANTQVAWVSPVRKRVGLNSRISVVRTAELRALAKTRGGDPAEVLQALGLVGRRGVVRRDYKVVVFDVRAEWLCRPIEGEEGTVEAGLARCPTGWQDRPMGTRGAAWSGCGYLLDTETGVRTLDVFAVSWELASSQGFCVLPLERFLAEAGK